MTTDWKALCKELLQAIDNLPWQYDWKGNLVGPLAEIDEAPFDRARAALAQPELEVVGPSESDVTELFYRHVGEGSEVGFEAAIEEALARWGHPTPQPIPVTERLPGPEDCDAEGRCWWFLPPQEVQPFKQNLCWVFRIRVPDDGSTWSHWLPYNALPLPQEPEQ